MRAGRSYSAHAVVRESAAITYTWAETKAEDWESFLEEKSEGFRYVLAGGC